MVPYDRKLFVFGGAGHYLSSIKMRMSFNDILVFDTINEEWQILLENELSPRKRMSHSASIMGCIMLVSGGFSTEAKKVLDDLRMFDCDLMAWIETKLFVAGTKVTEKNQSHLFENSHWPGKRQMHTITAIYD